MAFFRKEFHEQRRSVVKSVEEAQINIFFGDHIVLRTSFIISVHVITLSKHVANRTSPRVHKKANGASIRHMKKTCHLVRNLSETKQTRTRCELWRQENQRRKGRINRCTSLHTFILALSFPPTKQIKTTSLTMNYHKTITTHSLLLDNHGYQTHLHTVIPATIHFP